jgi:simple sugar transport system ATP-binding protein
LKEKIYAIELNNITKTFGEVVANKDVCLNVCHGEILAILGENGSGKTTLMNMLSGIYHPDSGEIQINGQPVTINAPKDAIDLKIGMIHQHFKLVDVLSAADNIIMGRHQKSKKTRKSKLPSELSALCESFGFDINLSKKIYEMSVSEKQTVEILKVLYQGADILILDEPTAVLTPQETKKLFAILKNMKQSGAAIVIITHKLGEVMEISDRVTVLRKGESIATVETAETTPKQLTELMVGRPVSLEIERPGVEQEKNMFEVHRLSVKNNDGVYALKDVSFSLNGGEILGVAGVAGSGQKELCETIAGLLPAEKGAVLYHEENILGKTPAEIINLGISMSFIPEDRLGMGLVSSMDITDNMLLKSYKNGKSPFVNHKPARELAQSLVEKLEIVTPSIKTPVRYLSGGNVQKVLLGREIESNPNLLITAYPVRGLDINSSYKIYDLLNEQKKKGVAILFIGEDLDVMLGLCDRVLVLCHGEITGIVDAKTTTKEEIGLLMTGETKTQQEEDAE